MNCKKFSNYVDIEYIFGQMKDTVKLIIALDIIVIYMIAKFDR